MIVSQCLFLLGSLLAGLCCAEFARRSKDPMRKQSIFALIAMVSASIHHISFIVFGVIFCSDADGSNKAAPYSAVVVAWMWPNVLQTTVVCMFLAHLKVLRAILVKQHILAERPGVLLALNVVCVFDWVLFGAGYLAIGLTNSQNVAATMYAYRACVILACGCVSLWYSSIIARTLETRMEEGAKGRVQLETFKKFRRKVYVNLGLCTFAVLALMYRCKYFLVRDHYIESEELEVCHPVEMAIVLAYTLNYVAICIFVFAFWPKAPERRVYRYSMHPTSTRSSRQNAVHPRTDRNVPTRARSGSIDTHTDIGQSIETLPYVDTSSRGSTPQQQGWGLPAVRLIS